MVTITYLKKRKYLEVRLEKKKECLKNKNLSSPGIFPIRLQDDVLGWKLSIGYDSPSNVFNLSINDLPFLGMPYQAQVNLKGP